ncbi:hypothetical protein A6I89_19770 [Prescottella equi]|uniref:Uncharacterized protein n=1 Tax=Rhodococcus hoagii TaxID=43767 RepID=A0AAE5IPS9_RHOHA|nr:hypothetical protein H849_01556 [Prescottella equi NBRC 101255 = C 7]ORL25349.1 hypothetical protein A6I89_19770 [Prescottella equi]ORL97976.1 hypothetical protein A5N73_20300 [Prescottella equi]ORM22481.1 hypothetical protein A5N68_20595 [Prescottella equi]
MAIACVLTVAGCSSGEEAPAKPEVTWESLQADYLTKLQQNSSSKLICGFQSGVADCLDRVRADLKDLDSAATEHLGDQAGTLSTKVSAFNDAHSAYVQGRCASAGGTLSCSTNLLKAENAAKDVRELLSSRASGS